MRTTDDHYITNLITVVSNATLHVCAKHSQDNCSKSVFKVKWLHCLFAICHTFTTVSNYHDKNPLVLVGNRDLPATDRFSPFVCSEVDVGKVEKVFCFTQRINQQLTVETANNV